MALKPLKPSKAKRKDSKHRQQQPPDSLQPKQDAQPQPFRRNCQLYKLPD